MTMENNLETGYIYLSNNYWVKSSLTFCDKWGTWLELTYDHQVKLREGMDLDLAAKMFWNAVSRLAGKEKLFSDVE